MGRTPDYKHERKWKVADPTVPTTPAPQPDDTLAKAMRNYLEGRHLDYTSALRAGWFAAIYYGARLIIPCVRTDGGAWWQARTITGHAKRWLGSHGYRGDAVCFIHGDASLPTIVCEGPMDALAAAGLGFPAIAILGVDPPIIVYDHVAKLVARSYMKNKAIILPDMDRVARWQETQQELGLRGVRGEIKQVPYGKKDLAECTLEERREFLYGVF